MKSFTKILAIGIVAALCFLFWKRDRPANEIQPVEKSSDAAQSSFAPSPPSAIAQALPKTAPNASNAIPSQHEQRMALIRLKLAEWQKLQDMEPANMEDDDPNRSIKADQLMAEMLAMVTDENVVEIIQSLSESELSSAFGTGTLHHWMALDPVAASNWMGSRPDVTEIQTLNVAHDWTGNPESLNQYTDQMPDSAWKQNFLAAAGSEMAMKDPLEAIKLANKMNPGDAQTNLLQSVACTWVDSDPAAALNWVVNVEDPALRERLVAQAVQSYALTDPLQAATWLVSEVKSEGILKDAAINIVGTWAMNDVNGVAGWVSDFPEGEIKTAAVQTISQYWMQTDPQAATIWIHSLSKSHDP